MDVWLVEPYYAGSHRAWAGGYRARSRHRLRLLTLPGRFWKWRMQGGAVTLARRAARLQKPPDLILASDMLNLPLFLAMGGARLASVPVVLYFHENQLTYPLQPGEKRDLHYGFINWASALRADAVCFNSAYHRDEFLDELPRLLKHFPDHTELWSVEELRARSHVLPLGLDLARLNPLRPEGPADIRPRPAESRPALLWNHRWEYDKDPETFFQAIYALAEEGLDFDLILLGETFRNRPDEFLEARERLPERIVHFGYAQEAEDYARLLWRADVVVSTAIHEFFGAAVVEACYCGCFPVLPRRLSYPELIPPEHHAACLYDDFEGLLSRLRWALTHVDQVRRFSLAPAMAGYDWAAMAPRYDDLLESWAGARPAPTPNGHHLKT